MSFEVGFQNVCDQGNNLFNSGYEKKEEVGRSIFMREMLEMDQTDKGVG